MRVKYYTETDSLYIGLKEEYEGPGYGQDLAPGITAHYSADRKLVSVEIESGAGKLADLEKLEVEGLPVSVEALKRAASR